MILQKEITAIRPQDYLHRWLLLKAAVEEYGRRLEAQAATGQQVLRFEKVLKELANIETSAQSFNSGFVSRELECGLVCADLQQDYSKMVEQLKTHNRDYEGKLFTAWRQALICRRAKEQQEQHTKGPNMSHNKRLMFLSSQILRKRRTASFLRQQKAQVILQHIAQIDNTLQQHQDSLLISLQELRVAHHFQHETNMKKNIEVLLSKADQSQRQLENRVIDRIAKEKIAHNQSWSEMVQMLDVLQQKILSGLCLNQQQRS